MRPDRIIVGEVRSSEVLDMIQAMNTGHDGSMTTLHANSPLDVLDRLEVLCLMSSPNISSEVAKRQIISAVDLVIHMVRLPDGSRRIIEISEVVKGKDYCLQDIFVEDSEKKGKLRLSGKVPTFYQRLKRQTGYTHRAFEQGA
jgi:pilus assembly protein CpaF